MKWVLDAENSGRALRVESLDEKVESLFRLAIEGGDKLSSSISSRSAKLSDEAIYLQKDKTTYKNVLCREQ